MILWLVNGDTAHQSSTLQLDRVPSQLMAQTTLLTQEGATKGENTMKYLNNTYTVGGGALQGRLSNCPIHLLIGSNKNDYHPPTV